MENELGVVQLYLRFHVHGVISGLLAVFLEVDLPLDSPLFDGYEMGHLVNLFLACTGFAFRLVWLASLKVINKFLSLHGTRIALDAQMVCSLISFVKANNAETVPIIEKFLSFWIHTFFICICKTEVFELALFHWVLGVVVPLVLWQVPVRLPFDHTQFKILIKIFLVQIERL